MDPHVLNIIVGLVYIVSFGGLSFLRREGLSAQFAFETLGIMILVEGVSYFTGVALHPVLFLLILYLPSVRVRLVVDIANMLSARGRQKDAIRWLQFALRLFPDPTSRLIVLVNMGIVQLRRKNPESAREILESVLRESETASLGLKYEAACRYNLGVALQQLGREAGAVQQFNEAINALPNSIYSKAAQRALQKRRKKDKPPESAEQS